MDGARQPGRALQVHEKLSSPSRRRMAEPCEAFQQHEAKQLRAQQHRAAFREEKTRKRRELAKRMDEVRVAKAYLLEEKKLLLERKMKRAEEKRQKHLAEIVKKAHDEESKKREIAFINTIEAQNKQHDFIARIQTQEERIQGLQVHMKFTDITGYAVMSCGFLLFFLNYCRKKDSVDRKSVIRLRKLWKSEKRPWRRSDKPKWRYSKKSDGRGKSASTVNTKRRRENDWNWLARNSVTGKNDCLRCKRPTKPRNRSCNAKFSRNKKNRPDATKKTLSKFARKPWNYPSCASHLPVALTTPLDSSTMRQREYAACVMYKSIPK